MENNVLSLYECTEKEQLDEVAKVSNLNNEYKRSCNLVKVSCGDERVNAINNAYVIKESLYKELITLKRMNAYMKLKGNEEYNIDYDEKLLMRSLAIVEEFDPINKADFENNKEFYLYRHTKSEEESLRQFININNRLIRLKKLRNHVFSDKLGDLVKEIDFCKESLHILAQKLGIVIEL